MDSEYGIKLAIDIITNHFGNLVAKVCECLLKKGALNLGNIIRFTELKPALAKNALLVLIQHNCAQGFLLHGEAGDGDDAKSATQYIALFDNILHRLRSAKFLAIINDEFDKPCYDIMEGLIQNGRLTLEQLVQRSSDSTKDTDPNVIRDNLNKLVRARYVERCPTAEPVISLTSEQEKEDAPAKKRGAKSAKLVVESQTLEQRVLAAAIPSGSLRFSVAMSNGQDIDEETSNNGLSGEKRKRDALESDIDTGGTDERLVLWRANFEEFIRRLRHKACIEKVRSQMDDHAAVVLNAMIDASKSQEQRVKTDYSVPLSVNSIYEEVIKSERGRNMTIDHVKASIVELSSPLPFVRVMDESYIIDFKHIIEASQSAEVESTVLRRYGRDAHRMFRFLSKTGRMVETDKISDTTLVEKKDTARILFKMWQDGYLLMEKVAAGSAQFLLWKVNKPTIWAHVLDEMLHAALNLRIRDAYETEQKKELLTIPREKREGLLKEKVEKLIKVRVLFQSSLMKLDDAIMLFYNF